MAFERWSLIDGVRRPGMAFLLLLIVFLALVLGNFDNFQIGVYGDDAQYITLARSLAWHGRFAYVNFPPSVTVSPNFPIGFPLALAPIAALFPDTLWPLKLIAFGATLLNGWLLYRLWPRWTKSSSWWGVAVAGAYWLLPIGVSQARMVMSEPLFLSYYLLGMAIIMDRLAGRRRRWQWAALALLALALTATRSVGFTIVAATALFLLLHPSSFGATSRPRLGQAGLAAGLLLFCLLMLHPALLPQQYLAGRNVRFVRSTATAVLGREPEFIGPDIITAVQPKRATFGQKITRHITRDLPNTLLPPAASLSREVDDLLASEIVQPLLAALVLLTLLIGSVTWMRAGGWHVLWFSIAGYIVFLGLWNWSGPRLLYPVVPHLIYAFILGVRTALKPIARQPERRARWLATAVALLLAAFALSSARISPSTQNGLDLGDRTAWLAPGTPPTAVVMTESPFRDYLYGNVLTVYWPQTQSAAALEAHIAAHKVDYLLLAARVRWEPEPLGPAWQDALIARQPAITSMLARGAVREYYADEGNAILVYKVQQ